MNIHSLFSVPTVFVSNVDVMIKPISAYPEAHDNSQIDYPPGLLPANSWRRIMANLGNYFGDNTETVSLNHHNTFRQKTKENSFNKNDTIINDIS